MALNARAWQLLLGRGRGRSLALFTRLVWVREAVNALLPVARVGGEVAAARMLRYRGVAAPAAIASLVLDMTVSLGTQALFTAAGLALMAWRHPGSALARLAWLSLALAVPVAAATAWVQRSGVLPAAGRIGHRLLGDRAGGLHGSAQRLDRALRALWRRRARVLGCAMWQLAGWTAAAGEIWIFLHAAGAEIALADVIVVEALVQAFASAAFVVPGALGVQEGAFLAAGGAVGLSPQVALALALARRARDLLVFVPALLAWQAGEGRRMLRPRAAAAPGRATARAWSRSLSSR
jgi:putative membrane protein